MNPPELAGLPRDQDGPVFAAPWEAQAFAMAVKLNEAGAFTWNEWAATLGAEIADAPDRPYYEAWLAALERLAEAKGLVTAPERQDRIDQWDAAARATPHGQPIELSRSSRVPETPR
ncbi:MAG: nitrile hydratase accessory protein [Hyphomicrobiales bacterium]